VARTILHLDMDAFYAAVEQRDNPALRGKPVIVGADPKKGRGRGVVSTASYEARRFGVGSAMPISEAYRRCPQGFYVPVDMDKYVDVSHQVMAILRRYTDLVEPVSIDEAFLDVTGSRRAFGDGPAIAAALKSAIRTETELTASVGVASCKLVAKIASDMRKPDGLVVVPAGDEASFLAPLPVRRLWGVGPKMEEQLLRIGIHTIGDLATIDERRLTTRLGTHGHDLVALAQGLDDRPVVADSGEAKSVGHEHTFDEDTADLTRLRRTLLDLSDSVAQRLRADEMRGRTVTLKYRDEDFQTSTRAETLAGATDSGDTIFRTAWRLFQAAHGARRVRLVGVSVSGFGPQLEMFAEPSAPADRLRDTVRQKFGDQALTRASLIGRRERRHPEAGLGDKAAPRKKRD
jgi:DNA polymerase-4